ncbi:hypothetical protein NLJ89_g8567 [Agrocybe chaxingu]|uniref:RBR-type E3 ubiquitin transferase n=1 Tax=Agrocybe chaxingu TaxID=84603 RepID=A0A9W8JSE5_9AGAR|nr:hypothetical protein NLJ89_g8567 [Agrocybe chaxingu]
MSAAGSSSSRVATKRNKAVPETQGTHAASTDATHIVGVKKRRRKVVAPTVAQQSILAHSEDSRSNTQSTVASLPKLEPGKNDSTQLKAPPSTVKKISELEENQLQLKESRSMIEGENVGESATSIPLDSISLLKKKRRKPAVAAQDEVVVVAATDSRPRTDSLEIRSILPTVNPVKSISRLLEVSSSTSNKQSSVGRIDDDQTMCQSSSGTHQLGAVGEGARNGSSSIPAEADAKKRREKVDKDGIECQIVPTPSSDIGVFDARSILPRVKHAKSTSKLLEASSSVHQNVRPPTSSWATPPSVSTSLPPASVSTVTPQDPSVRVRLPPTTSFPSPSIRILSSTPELPPRFRSMVSVPQKSSLDDVQNWDTVSGFGRWDGAASESSRSSVDSDEERVAICRKIASPDPFPLENWDPRADESAWSDSNVTDDESSKRVSVGRESSVPSAARTSSVTNSTTASHTPRNPPVAMEKKFISEPPEVRRPRPRTTERCHKWLQDRCRRGYNCPYIHDDLDYLDDRELPKLAPGTYDPLKGAVRAHLTSQPERTFVRRPPETVGRVLHQHIHVKFGSGFQVTELDTGFESPWIFVSGFPDHLTDYKIETMLRRFGDVTEIRRPAQPVSPLSVKVHFSKVSEAFKAFTSLHGTVEYGRKLETRMAVENKRSGTFFKNTTVRIDWEAPSRNVYMGYADLEKAEGAVRLAREVPYGEYQATAALHYALPAVGKVTVKFTGVPPDVTEKGMEIYGAHQGMVTERPNYAGITVDETISTVKRLLMNFRSKMVDFEIKSAPYREGKMRAWAVFSSPKDAEAAAQNVHNRKPAAIGHTRVMARHMKSIAFSISLVKARRVGAEIKAFTEKIWRQGAGCTLSTQDKGAFVSLRLCGEDLKVLGKLKAELERILNGEPVMEDDKMVWDDYFGRQQGLEFFMELERRFPGVTVERIYARRSIRLFGVAEKRAQVRRKIIEKVAERRRRNVHTIIVSGQLADALSKFKDGFAAMEKTVGEGNINLDLWESRLSVSGDMDMFTTVKDLLHDFRQNHNLLSPWDRSADVCPACFTDASSPIKLPCGHTWCRTCLQRYLKVATEKQTVFPLKCHGIDKKCGEGIPLLTAREILEVSDFDALIEAAFSAHVQTHPGEFHYCPTPDCSQIYRSTPEGISMQCPECLVQVCTACHTEAHDGLTCAESRDGDDLFKEWASKHDIKQCPNCKMAIEKDEGCNHMTFPNGTGIYGHMRAEHGSWGLGPIV